MLINKGAMDGNVSAADAIEGKKAAEALKRAIIKRLNDNDDMTQDA